MRLAWAIKEGVALAFSRGTVPKRYLDAVCDTPEEAERRTFQANRARREAAAGMRG